MKNIKKIILLTLILTVSVGVNASINNSGTGPNFNNSGTGPNLNNSGTGPNIMTGGGGGNGAIGAGLGSQNSGFNSGPAPSMSSGRNIPQLSLVGIVSWLASLMNQLIYVIIGATLVVFLYGIFKLSFVDGQKPEAREQSRRFMFWGIVSLFVMVSVWGLVNVLKVTFFGPGDLIIPRLR